MTKSATILLALGAALLAGPAFAKPAKPLDQVAQERFKVLDADGDGSVSREEVAASFKARAEKTGKLYEETRVNTFFERIDTNADGKISPEELRAQLERQAANRKKKAAQ